MKKYVISAGFIIILIGGYFFVSRNQEISNEIPVTEGMSFNELINSDGSYKCTYVNIDRGIENTGIVYISEGKLIDENEGKIGKTDLKTLLIVRDGYTYSWTSLNADTIFRKKLVDEIEGFDAGPASVLYLHNREPIDPKYTCTTWTPDENIFNLPRQAKIVDAE